MRTRFPNGGSGIPPARGGAPESWTRPEAVARLRAVLLELCGDGRTMCRVAAEEGIFCRGFRRWPEHEFHERWKRQLGVSTHLTRDQMEELADIWQLCEQLRRRDMLICDAQTAAPGACRGWNEFTDRDLERFCLEILGKQVEIRTQRDQFGRITQTANIALDRDPKQRSSLDPTRNDVGNFPVTGEERP